MAVNEAKEYLQQAWDLDKEIKLREEKIIRMRSSLYGKTQCYQNNGGKGNSYGSFDGAVQKVVDYEAKTKQKISELVDKRIEIENVIDSVLDDKQRKILTRRYLLNQKWELISELMGFDDVRQVYRIHGAALKNICFPKKDL